MHSSRMRTGRSLTVCCSLLPGGGSNWSGGVLPGLGGVCLVRGGSPWSGGGGLPGPRGCLPDLEGFSLVLGGSPETPPVDRITDTCKNITLATTSLRPVIMMFLPSGRYRVLDSFKGLVSYFSVFLRKTSMKA